MWSSETRTNRGPPGGVLLTVALWSGWMLVGQSEHVIFYTEGKRDSYELYFKLVSEQPLLKCLFCLNLSWNNLCQCADVDDDTNIAKIAMLDLQTSGGLR